MLFVYRNWFENPNNRILLENHNVIVCATNSTVSKAFDRSMKILADNFHFVAIVM